MVFHLLVTEPVLGRGDSVYLIGLSRSLQATSRKSTVTNPCAALNIGSADCPRYRATNMEVIELDTGMKIFFFSLTFGVVLCLGLLGFLICSFLVFLYLFGNHRFWEHLFRCVN